MDPPSSTELKDGGPDFRKIYEAEVGPVWRYLARIGVPPSDVEDLVHEVFVVLHRRLSDYDASRPVRPWLLGIAHRVAARHRQRAHVRREIAQPDIEQPAPGRRQDDAVAAKELQEAMEAAFVELPIEQRAVFILHHVEEHPIPAVAEILDVPVATAYSRLRLARQRLRQAAAAWRDSVKR